MDDWINELIAQYHLIFNNYRDMRLLCTMDKNYVHCYGIDKIEMCVYCIMQDAGAVNNLKWEIQETGNNYYFIPVIEGTCFKETMQRLSRKYPICKEDQRIYHDKSNLNPLFKVCQGDFLVNKEKKSCDIVVDMIFNFNRSNREKADLDNFCALFCCHNVNLLHAFLVKVNEYIEKHIKDKRKLITLLKEVTLFIEKIFTFRNCIKDNKGNIAENAYLKTLKETSMLIARLLRQRDKNDELALMQYQNMPAQYDIKIKRMFPTSYRGWNYNAGLGSKGSCQKLFRQIANKCIGEEIKYESNVEDWKIVKKYLPPNN